MGYYRLVPHQLVAEPGLKGTCLVAGLISVHVPGAGSTPADRPAAAEGQAPWGPLTACSP